MKLLTSSLILSVFLTAGAARAEPAVLAAADDAQIRALVSAVPEAMNLKDWKKYASLFAEDADWINVAGMFWQGKANLVKAHAAYGSTVFRNGGFTYSDLVVRSVASGVAVVVVTEHSRDQVMPDGSSTLPGGDGRLSFVVAKRAGVWKIVLGHNTSVNKDAEPYDPVKGWTPSQ